MIPAPAGVRIWLATGHTDMGRGFEAACWAHGRRKFFELAELQKAPVAIEAMKHIDELFAIEREINGKPLDVRKAVRQERSKPIVDALEAWLRAERKKLVQGSRRQGHRLQPQAMECIHSLPR